MKSSIEKQTDLIKLILQKMEIKTESDYFDDNDVNTYDSNRRKSLWKKGLENQNSILRMIATRQFMSSRPLINEGSMES